MLYGDPANERSAEKRFKNMRCIHFTTFWKVGIPSALTMTFAGIKVAIDTPGNARRGGNAGGVSGLGYMILMGRSYGRVDWVHSGIVVIGVIARRSPM
jgi:NitT/TauT family transport system permease protein